MAQLAALRAAGWLTSWFVREPAARFVSVFRHFARLERARSPQMTRANADGRLFESIATFAERAFNDFPCDKHIAPQTGWGAEQCEIIAPLERSADVALPVTFPRINSNVGCEEYDTPSSVEKFYANDIAYWERVRDSFDPKDFRARRPDLDGDARRQAQVVRPDESRHVSD